MSKANRNGAGAVVDLASALARIEREYGAGAMVCLDGEHLPAVEAIPTGALSLDLALGVGGLPRGRIVEVYGPESSGKTTLTYHAIAEAQRLGGRCAFIDAEHSMDPAYAAAIGVDIEALLVSQPDYGEQALEIVDLLARSGELALVVIDSVAALVPKAELEGADGRADGRAAGADDGSGDAQAGRAPAGRGDDLPVHQPAARKGRRPLRAEGDPAGRPGAEVLCHPAARHPPGRDPERGRGVGRQPGPGQGRQEQGRRAVRAGRVRHRLRPRHLPGRLRARPRGRARCREAQRRPLRLSARSDSARGGRRSRPCWRSGRSWSRRSRGRCGSRSALRRRAPWGRSRPEPTPRALRRSGLLASARDGN